MLKKCFQCSPNKDVYIIWICSSSVQHQSLTCSSNNWQYLNFLIHIKRYLRSLRLLWNKKFSVRYDVIKTEKVTLDFLSRNDASSVPKIPQIGVNGLFRVLSMSEINARPCITKNSELSKWYDFSRWRKWDSPKLGPLLNFQDRIRESNTQKLMTISVLSLGSWKILNFNYIRYHYISNFDRIF